MSEIGALQYVDISRITLNDSDLTAELQDVNTTFTLQRDMTQASTVSLAISDYNRGVVNSSLAVQASTMDVGALPFTMVQVNKSADLLTLTFEDRLINRLRLVRGPLAQAPGVLTRVQFAAQLCAAAGVFFNGDTHTPSAAVPLTRGTTSDPNEDTWTCLNRLAADVGYRCFSDGSGVLFGPDSWLLDPVNGPSPTAPVIQENTELVDYIDFDFDIGKPVALGTIHTYADWSTNCGAPVNLTGLGPANGLWLVKSIVRELHLTAATVTITRPLPTLPEPKK